MNDNNARPETNGDVEMNIADVTPDNERSLNMDSVISSNETILLFVVSSHQC